MVRPLENVIRVPHTTEQSFWVQSTRNGKCRQPCGFPVPQALACVLSRASRAKHGVVSDCVDVDTKHRRDCPGTRPLLPINTEPWHLPFSILAKMEVSTDVPLEPACANLHPTPREVRQAPGRGP